MTAAGWISSTEAAVPDSSYAGRGIERKGEEIDDQIEALVSTGRILMPLWGASLSRTVAEGYGDRFLFRLDGPFHGVPAWVHSGIKQEEWELIVGGEYEVLEIDKASSPGTTSVRLCEVATIGSSRRLGESTFP